VPGGLAWRGSSWPVTHCWLLCATCSRHGTRMRLRMLLDHRWPDAGPMPAVIASGIASRMLSGAVLVDVSPLILEL
jgi:hypothetical protein